MAATPTPTTHPPETNKGIVTSWLAMTTSGTVVPSACTSAIYSGLLGAIAWDPFIATSVDFSLICIPPEADQYWNFQSSKPGTVLSLGPFVCPSAYTTAATSVLNSKSTSVACCPSNYEFRHATDNAKLGECVSTLTFGQPFTYFTFISRPKTATTPTIWTQTSTIISATDGTVAGVHINGWVFADQFSSTSFLSALTTTASISSAASASSTTSTSSTTDGSTSTPSQAPFTIDSGISTGSRIGIGVGVAFGTLGICCLAVALFLLWRRRKSSHPPNPTPLFPSIASAELRGNPTPDDYTNAQTRQPQEMEHTGWQKPFHVYEMSASEQTAVDSDNGALSYQPSQSGGSVARGIERGLRV